MLLEFAHPLFLLLLVPLLVHALWMARRLQLLTPVRRRVALALRILLLSLLVLAVAGARWARYTDELTVFFALDVSQSLPETQRQFARTYMQKNLGEMGPRDQAGIVVFGGDPALEASPSRVAELPALQAVVERSRTNIADALQLAMACFVEQTQKRIVLLSDGNQNAGDAVAVARSAAAAGIVVDVFPLQYENRNDVIVEKALVENRVSLEEPFDIRVIATARRAAAGKLSVHQDGKLIGTFDVELQEGKKNVFTVPTQVRDSGFHTFDVQIDVPDDLIPENNRAYAFTYGQGEPHVLLVDGDANPSAALPAVLRSEKINIVTAGPSEMPVTLPDLQRYDAVIFNNVAASDITREQMQLVERAVHDLGLGFMMIGGENSFGAGGYNDSPIETVLPVEMELKNEKIMPQGALVPIIHTVEIPQGQFWSVKIVEAALDVLSPRDLMGVLYYGWQGGEAWLFPLQPVGNKAMMRSAIQGIQPGDMPSFDTTLQMAYTALSGSSASVKHIVIISDGDPATPNQQLAQQIRGAGITISTVCINPHSPRDTQVMRDLARWGGGNFYNPSSYNNLPQIFIREAATVRKSLIFEEPFQPAEAGYSQILTGLAGNTFPQLRGYVGTSAKGLADVPLVTHNQDPLLAHWRHGLGKSVAWTSDAKERWANPWLSWDRYAKFWSQAVRWMLRSPADANYEVTMSIDGARGKVTIDAVEGDGRFRNFLQIEGSVITPKLDSRAVVFRQTAPGRYEAEFDVDEPGPYMLGAMTGTLENQPIETEGAGEGGELITAGTTLSYSPEFQDSRSNLPLLLRLAEITGGRVLTEAMRVFEHNLPARAAPRPLWPELLLASLLLLLADVFTRRVMIGPEEVAAGWRTATHWAGRRLRRRRAVDAEASSPTEQLLQARQRVGAIPAAPDDEAQRESFLATLKQVKVEHSAQDLAAPRERPVPRPAMAEKQSLTPAAATPEEDETRFTNQLLKARERARRQRQSKEGEEPHHE